MSVANRLRRALGGRRPGVELVRAGPAVPPPAPEPRPRRALPAPEHPLCPRCRTRHAPHPHPATGGGLAAYGQTILPDPDRPAPLGRGPAHDQALYRDQVNPWRYGTPDPPPPSLDLAELRAELYAPRTYWWEQRER